MKLAQGLVIATLAVGALAQINCKGSAACFRTSQQNSQNILNSVQGIDTGRTYQNGEHIACAGSVCAFLQNTGGITGDLIKDLVQDLVNAGCAVCGSVPVFFNFGDNNDNDHGGLIINAVTDTSGCSGLC